jgi:hypothetical protein
VLFYFGLLVLLRVGFILTEGEGWGLALQSALWLAFLAFAAVGILSLLAWLYARSTIYSITSRRVVIRSGVVVPMAVNLPFKSIESAGLRVYSDGAGDIPLALIPEQKVNYLIVWPNVRPWTFSKAQPMLRALPDVEKTAELLADALKAATEAESAEVAQEQSSQPSGSDATQSREAIRESTESSDAGSSAAGEPLPTTPSS